MPCLKGAVEEEGRVDDDRRLGDRLLENVLVRGGVGGPLPFVTALRGSIVGGYRPGGPALPCPRRQLGGWLKALAARSSRHFCSVEVQDPAVQSDGNAAGVRAAGVAAGAPRVRRGQPTK